MRPVLPLAALLAALAAPAQAAPSCPLLTDPRGDVATQGLPSGAGQRPGDDILSADLWADRSTVTGVLRLDSLPGGPEQQDLPGVGSWWIWFVDTPEGQLRLQAEAREGRWLFGADFAQLTRVGDEGSSVGRGSAVQLHGATGAVDRSRKAVTVRLPLSALRGVSDVRPGTVWDTTSVASYTSVGLPEKAQGGGATTGSYRDEAWTDTDVVVGRAGCRP